MKHEESKKTILAIDSVSLNLMIIKNILSEDYNVRIAKSGELALFLLESIEVNLILLDIDTPETSDFLRVIQETKEINEIPIISITSYPTRKDKDYIVKPINPKILKEKILKVFNMTEIDRRQDEIKDSKIAAPKAKVLIVDDIDINLKVAAALLETFEIQADTANSGKRAIEMVKVVDYDLIFIDHMMPVMDGIETANAIRCLDKKFENLPIIALSSNSVSGIRVMFLASGLDDYLCKPIELVKLTCILKKWIPKLNLK